MSMGSGSAARSLLAPFVTTSWSNAEDSGAALVLRVVLHNVLLLRIAHCADIQTRIVCEGKSAIGEAAHVESDKPCVGGVIGSG